MHSVNHTSPPEDEYDLRECAKWLNRCRIIPDDHPTLMPGGCGLQLLQTLMDGVAVCNLLSTLTDGEVDPKKMKDFSPRPQQSQFLCFQNIRIFISLCEEEFGIDKKFLIEPSDLYHAKNFGKVIELLSKLSRCPRAKRCGISGFPSENSNLQVSHEYYNNLKDIAASMDDMRVTAESNYADMEEETNEIVYDTIVHGGRKVSPVQVEVQSTSPRSLCVKEIVTTEKNYVDVLKMLIEKYKSPLAKVLSSQELEEIFKHIEELHCIHRELLSNLSLAVSPTLAVFTIDEVFIKIRDRLLIYGEYCGHVQKAQTLVLEIIKHDEEKLKKIRECQEDSGNYSKFHLTELLTVPMQRVLRYHLLLENLCKLTTNDHEKPELLRALDGMRELAQTINEVKRDLDTIAAIDQIQASLLEITLPPDKKLSSYGRRHMDGELRVLNHLISKSKTRYVFLFDKILLLCKSKGDNYTFMAAYHITNGAPQALSLPSKKVGKFHFEFTIPIAGDLDEEVQLTFFAKSEELRNAWIKAAETALSNQFPPGAEDNGYRFEMWTFKNTTYCCMCKKLLQGVFYQGYKCRETNLAAHKACLVNISTLLPPRTAIIPINGSTYPRGVSRMSCTIGSSTPRQSVPVPPPPPPPPSAPVFASVNRTFLRQRMSQNTSSISTDSTNSSAPSIRAISDSIETLMDDFLQKGAGLTTATAIETYSGDPSPPSTLEDTGNVKPLLFFVGDKITLAQPHSVSAWLQGRLDDREGWFPASHVDVPVKPDFPPNPVSRRQSACNSRSPPVDQFPSRSLSLMVDLPPIPSNSVNVDRADDTACQHAMPVARSVSLRNYVAPNNTNGITKGKHFSTSTTPFSPVVPSCLLKMPWYFGEMDRIEATQILTGCVDGTFLVRISKNVSRMGEYSLSVVYQHPRHIRIQQHPDTSFSLSPTSRFKSLEALVDFYRHVSLNECFEGLQTRLLFAYIRCPDENVLFYAQAQYDFEGEGNAHMLPLRRGDTIYVISTRGKERGWWRGWLNGRIGFFPLSFVTRQP